jgi:hypothetical protein
MLTERAPEKFDMILSADNPNYVSLPGAAFGFQGVGICRFVSRNRVFFGVNDEQHFNHKRWARLTTR